MSRLTLSLLLSALLLTAGCPRKSTTVRPDAKNAAKAERLLQSGKPKQAAQVYRQLADKKSTRQNHFRLLTAESLIQSGNIEDAKTYADLIDARQLSPQHRNKLHLVHAQIHLGTGEAEQALKRLSQVSPDQLDLEEQITYHQSLAFAYSLAGELLQSVRERILLDRLLDASRQQDNHAAILETLSLLPVKTLQHMQSQSSDPLTGWLSLAILLKQKNLSSEQFNTGLERWRQSFPSHPASGPFLDNYLAKSRHAFQRPDAIAILLPESGSYAHAAKAIREGFMATYYHQQDSTFKPSIRFYDSESQPAGLLYRQAVSDGAELIIGPLNKKNIQALLETSPLTVPVLALNYIDGLARDNLYQFGLSPIDDVQQVTAKASLDGHRRALLLIPDTSLGQRIGAYFEEFWQQHDGVILEHQVYDPQQSDFTQPIKRLLNLDESERRYRKIRQLIPGIKFVPRRRHDIDSIFLNASPYKARLINPQLRFYRALDVPVYATAHVYTGRPHPSLDIDLDGIRFCDIPWLFDETYQGPLSLAALQKIWRQFPNVYYRLIALGIDAYNIVPHLDKLDTIQYSGATGNLLLTRENRIKRNLVCAGFSGGIPVISGFVETFTPSPDAIPGPEVHETYEPDSFQDI